MSSRARHAAIGVWTGPLLLAVHASPGGEPDLVEVAVGFDTLVVRHEGRLVAILDRDQFRGWLRAPDPRAPLRMDETAWSARAGRVEVRIDPHTVDYTVDPDSWAALGAVI